MNKYKIYPETTAYYFSTIAIIQWLPVFKEDKYCNIIIDSLKFCQENKGLGILGYVIMPTHLHLLTFNSAEKLLSGIMRDFKAFTSKKLRKQLEEDGNENFIRIFSKAARSLHKQEFKIWQDGFHPVALFSEKWFAEKMDYIHMNPVRKGFVELPEHWKYSSARNWITNDHRIIRIDKGCTV